MNGMRIVLVLLVSGAAMGYANDKIPAKNERLPLQKELDGYKDTPMHPDGKFHIHDPDRPQPPVAAPKYDGKPVPPPDGATVIFDGRDTDQFQNKSWPIKDGIMLVGKGHQETKKSFGDMHLHLEFRIPENSIGGWGQKQGNSGVFLMGLYEIQILNGWANRTYPDGMLGALYGDKPPLVNAAKKPGEWQSYDIHFTAPVFADANVVSPARVTVYLNNVLVQDKSAFRGASSWRRIPRYKPHPDKLPLKLQAHGNRIEFRNIWAVEDGAAAGERRG